MSYDLAVWVGERPLDDEAAGEEYERRADASEHDETAPAAAVTAFVSGLLERWPEGRDDGVWSMEPVLEGRGGDFLCLTMTLSDHLDDIVDRAAELAHRYDLVLYDPQREALVEHTTDVESADGNNFPKVSAAEAPDDLDRAIAIDVLKMKRDRLDRLIVELASGTKLNIPHLLALTLMNDHEDMALPPEVWRGLLSELETWWSSGPDVNNGRDWLSTDGNAWLILSEPTQPEADWDLICSWDLTSYAAMLLWGLSNWRRVGGGSYY